MLNKKIIIDLNDENENKNKNEKIQDTFDIGINFSDNNEENDTKEKKIDNNKEKQSEGKNKSNNFGLNTSLTGDENTTKNKDFIKQIAKQGVNVNKNIDDEVYNQILKKYKKKSKVKYIVITLFSFSIICAGLAYIFSTNNIVLTTIFRNKTNWNNKNTGYQIKYENLKKDITSYYDNKNTGYQIKYENLKKDITSYYDNKIIEKTKGFTKKTKENTLFKFDILKYEFNNKTIKFKQFNKQVNNLISSIK